MSKRKFTTKQEREQYIQNFLTSGKTQLSWCKENEIKISTLGRWLKEYRASQSETKFIPLVSKPKSVLVSIPSSQEILIEIGLCKIHVPEQTGMQLILQAMKAVKDSDVSI